MNYIVRALAMWAHAMAGMFTYLAVTGERSWIWATLLFILAAIATAVHENRIEKRVTERFKRN
jgi:hypothetical protein